MPQKTVTPDAPSPSSTHESHSLLHWRQTQPTSSAPRRPTVQTHEQQHNHYNQHHLPRQQHQHQPSHAPSHHSSLPSPQLSIDAVLGIATGVAIGGCTALCIVVTLFPIDIERVLCAIFLSLGYFLLPALAIFLIPRATSSELRFSTSFRPHSHSHPHPRPSPGLAFLARFFHAHSNAVLASVNASTRVTPYRPAPTSSCPAAATDPQCSVCLDDVRAGNIARVLPCNHVFHKECADAWLLDARKNSCPLCIRRVCSDRDDNMVVLPNPVVTTANDSSSICPH